MFKQAYLIIAHHEFEVLKKLILMLDHPANDIFIHIDKKVKKVPVELETLCKYSKIQFIKKRYSVYWGHQSIVKVEMELYKEAFCKYPYDYYHLISGVDLPLKKQNELIEYLQRGKRKEYISYDVDGGTDIRNLERMKYYWIHLNNTKKIANWLQYFFLKIQKGRINRLKQIPFPIQKGSQWCSLSNEAVRILLENEKLVNRMTFMTNCPDEIWKQTILLKYFKEEGKLKLAKDSLRYIDWKRGNGKSPHTFTIEDKERLLNNNFFFARKFSYDLDSEIVEELYKHIILDNFSEAM